MANKTYMVETVVWDDDEKDWEDEEEHWDLSGIEAMKYIAAFLEKYPEAKEADVLTEPEDGMFISLNYYNEEARREYWLSAYCRDRSK